MCIQEMQHSLALKDLSCFRTYDGHQSGNATLHNQYAPLLNSGFSRYEVGNEYVCASANSKRTFTSILEEPGADYGVYMRNQIQKFESEIRKNGLWKVVLEMVPQHDQCVVYLRKLWDDVYSQTGVDTIPVALATLIYYIVCVTLKRMQMVKVNQHAIQLNNIIQQHEDNLEQSEDNLKQQHFRNFMMKFHSTVDVKNLINELQELSKMIETTISEISREVPPPTQYDFSSISISAHELTRTQDSIWSLMQDAPTKSLWSDFKDTLGIKKAQTVVHDMSTQAITDSLKIVHDHQYIYDLSESQKFEYLREYGLLYNYDTPTESPHTCQQVFSMATPSNPIPPFLSFRHTSRQPQCAVTRGKTIENRSVGR